MPKWKRVAFSSVLNLSQRNHIRYYTTWQFDAPLEVVCNAIYSLENWPKWWPSVKSVDELAPCNSEGVGGQYHFVWKGALPYRLRFVVHVTQVIPSRMIEGLVMGDVKGVGIWRLSSDGAITTAQYEWRVFICNRMIRLLSYIAYPVVRWNHNFVMHQGGVSLARMLKVNLVKIEHS